MDHFDAIFHAINESNLIAVAEHARHLSQSMREAVVVEVMDRDPMAALVVRRMIINPSQQMKDRCEMTFLNWCTVRSVRDNPHIGPQIDAWSDFVDHDALIVGMNNLIGSGQDPVMVGLLERHPLKKHELKRFKFPLLQHPSPSIAMKLLETMDDPEDKYNLFLELVKQVKVFELDTPKMIERLLGIFDVDDMKHLREQYITYARRIYADYNAHQNGAASMFFDLWKARIQHNAIAQSIGTHQGSTMARMKKI